MAEVLVACSKYFICPPLLGINPSAVGSKVSGLVPINSAPLRMALVAIVSFSYVSFLSKPTITASTLLESEYWLNELNVSFNPFSPIIYISW